MNTGRRWVWVFVTTAVATVSAVLSAHAAVAKGGQRPAGIAAARKSENQIMLRVRVADMAPATHARIRWIWGGQGLSTSDPVTGELTAIPPQPHPTGPADEKADVIADKTKDGDVVWVKTGVWLEPVPLSHFGLGGLPFVTLKILGKPLRRGQAPKDTVEHCRLEFELNYGGKIIKTFQEDAPDGSTVEITLPVRQLAADGSPTEGFIEGAGGLLAYAKRREEFVEALPWAGRPLPKRYGIVTDCFGFQGDFAAHTANKEVMLAELRTCRQLGVNGLRMMSEFVKESAIKGEEPGREFTRARIGGAADYLVPSPGAKVDGAGCPYHPATISAHAGRVRDAVARGLERAREMPVQEEWLLTQDEIGAFYSGAKKTEHLATCQFCRQAYRDFVKRMGYGPGDFGVNDWSMVMPSMAYLEGLKEQGYTPAPKKKRAAAPAGTGAGAAAAPEDPETAGDPDQGDGGLVLRGDLKLPVSARGWALSRYLTREFNNETSAMLFDAQRLAYAAENEKKRKALAEGRTDAAEARQPWLYTYSLRRSSFIMGGDALDYFDFYRQADNGFMYETSNRDPRAWPWDSYLCDVGRSVSARFGTRFAVCVKPHRGATVQRALTAVSRDAKLLYWYTYGPNWAKGDSFSGQFHCLKKASWFARLLAAAEDVLYDGKWAVQPEVAVVRLRTSESFETSTSWENGKWVYSALAHAHIPVDALNETLLLTEDLSPYKAIYVNGPNIRRAAAVKLAQWVEQGGTLYVSGGGLARDEGNEPLTSLQAVLGLRNRGSMDDWRKMPRYGAAALGHLTDLPGVTIPAVSVSGGPDLPGTVPLLAGREVLAPAEGTTVLARYSDGGVAATRHAQGKGQAVVVGFHAGIEYSADVQNIPYDTARDYKSDKRNYVTIAARLAGVKPVVDASEPAVEGVLIRNAATGRQAVTLMNWAFKVDDDRERSATEFSDLAVRVRGAGAVSKIRSAALEKEIPFEQRNGDLLVKLPTLADGDILLLEP